MVACSLKRYRLVEKGALNLVTKLLMIRGLCDLLIGGSCDCLLYQQGECSPGVPFCGWTWALSRSILL